MSIVARYLSRSNNECIRPKFAYLLMVSGIIFVTIAIAINFLLIKLEKSNPAWLPEVVAGLRLEPQVLGKEAVSEINRLHGKSFTLVDGAVSRYGSGQVTLWVSQAKSTNSAEEILLAMRDSIAARESPYTPLGESKHAKRIVYEVEGLGQLHYYFRSSDLVVWVATDKNCADAALADALGFFP
jgi:hypothetical protein